MCQKRLVQALVLVAASLVDTAAAEEVNAPQPQYQFNEITIAAASADEPLAPTLTVKNALQYLDDGAVAWSGTKKCVTCHTNGMYMALRPALTPRVGEPHASIREFFVETLRAKQVVPHEKLRKGTSPEQVIYLAAGLAEWDRHVTGRLSPETIDALRLMFAIQSDDGTWGNKACWPPYESDSYHPATVAAMAITAAPGWLEHQESNDLQEGVERLKSYLRNTEPPHDYVRVLLVWAATQWPGLIDDARRDELIAMLEKHQHEDGGWSIRDFATPEQWGDGLRAEKLREESDFASPLSDGHMTGLALCVLADNDVSKMRPSVANGLAWLKTHQRVSGRWWTRSLNTDNHHFITYSGTAYPLLALDKYDEWPSATFAAEK